MSDLRAALLLAGCSLAGCAAPLPEGPDALGRVYLPGGVFVMGSDVDLPDEYPAHEVAVAPFWIDTTEVTVAQFAAFVAETGYRTEAERIGWAGVFDGGWRKVDGADWRNPDGPGEAAADSEPVTQVSWHDARAYCRARAGRLPTEAEFEYALRGGRDGMRYAWGDSRRPGDEWPANWWQGPFPERDHGLDGFAGRAPVASFAPGRGGLYDLAGNVWEWCEDGYDRRAYRRGRGASPAASAAGEERVIRGGSWACSPSVCEGFRASARSHSPPDSALNHLGFRCVADRPVREPAGGDVRGERS